MNDVKTDLDDAMRMLVALHEEHMGIHEQLDALGVPYVAKRDGQWRLALLTNRLEMAERNLVQERARREDAERQRDDARRDSARVAEEAREINRAAGEQRRADNVELMEVRAERDDMKNALDAERAAHEATRQRLAEDQALLTECRRQRDAAVEERNAARRKLDGQRVEDGRWLVAGGPLPGVDSEWHVLSQEKWARDEYTRLINRGARAYLCRVIEGPNGGGKTEPEKAPDATTPADVDALLREADAIERCDMGGWALIHDLAAALRAERARVFFHQRAESEIADHNRVARSHLRAVLAHFSPDPTRGPTVAQRAHAFLDGATIHPLAQDEAETNLRADVQRLRGELEAGRAKCQALERVLEDIGTTLDAYHAPPGLMAERVEWLAKNRTLFEPSGDVVERLTRVYVQAPGDADAGIRAVLVKVAEMVPSEEEVRAEVMKRSHGYACEGTIDTTCRAVRSLILSRLGLTTTSTPVEPVQRQPLDGLDVWLAETDRRCPPAALPHLATTEPIYWHSDRLAATLARELRRMMAGPWLVVWKGIDGAINVTSQTTERAARRAFDMSSGMVLCRVVETKEGAK